MDNNNYKITTIKSNVRCTTKKGNDSMTQQLLKTIFTLYYFLKHLIISTSPVPPYHKSTDVLIIEIIM